nr:putative sulfate exporter family transporter [Corallococcus macrosporus]
MAVGLCGILGTAGVLLYVFAGPLLGFSTLQLAVLSGSTPHEVAQVMAAAFSWGTEAGDLGTRVKLTRVVLLAPSLRAGLSTTSVFLMVIAMAAMGLATPFQMIRKAGMKVIYAGLLGFGGLARMAWGLIRLLRIG